MPTITQPKTIRATLSGVRLRQVLGDERHGDLYRIERKDLDYGAHWCISGGFVVYTAEGLRIMADKFDEQSDKAAALVLRAEADRLTELSKQAPEPGPLESVRKTWEQRRGDKRRMPYAVDEDGQ